MTAFGIILTYMLGISIILNISSKFKKLEILGLSFITGLGYQTMAMFLMNILGFTFKLTSIVTISIVTIVSLLTRFVIINKLIKRLTIDEFTKLKTNSKTYWTEKFKSTNIIYIICLLLSLSTLYLISTKSLFWPTFSSDSVTSFDLFAKSLAHEGKILNSMILEGRIGFGAAYPPLYSLALSYAYILGSETSKIIPILSFISFAIIFYAFLKKEINRTNAMFFTFLAILTPEFLAQSAINTTSAPQATYTIATMMTLFTWDRNSETRYFYLSALLLGFSCFIRSESIIFVAIVSLYFIFKHKTKPQLKKYLYYLTIAIIPFIAWQLFLKINIEHMDRYLQIEVIKYPNFDTKQISKILNLGVFVISRTTYYGANMVLFIVLLGLNIKNIFKRKEKIWLIISILLSFFLYLILVNQFKMRSDLIDNIIKYSGKRYFFSTSLLVCYYLSTNSITKKVFNYIEAKLNFSKPK